MLRTLFRSSDILVRFGGDEFVILGYLTPACSRRPASFRNPCSKVKFWEKTITE